MNLCPECNGTGKKHELVMVGHYPDPVTWICPECGGSGEY